MFGKVAVETAASSNPRDASLVIFGTREGCCLANCRARRTMSALTFGGFRGVHRPLAAERGRNRPGRLRIGLTCGDPLATNIEGVCLQVYRVRIQLLRSSDAPLHTPPLVWEPLATQRQGEGKGWIPCR